MITAFSDIAKRASFAGDLASHGVVTLVECRQFYTQEATFETVL